MLVADVMIKEVITISSFAKLREAMRLMREKEVKSLVVEKNTKTDAYGIITYSDIIKATLAEDGDIDLLNVFDICTKPAISIGAKIDIKHAASLMVNQELKRLLVLTDNELSGFISMNDIMSEVLANLDSQ
ncbi:CBS domain-containing protein [Salinivibrio socompensis]|uniref:CBS domain-containing protein n=1 Tax=Salinivibrio socompensis TaxID=1510206 RepID=UPI0004720050|nr:CBS domain-containing protein [Salinivibrio socompensis]